MQMDERDSNHPRMLLGGLIILLGIFFLLAEMDIVEFRDLIRLAPSLLIVAGAWILFRRRGGNPILVGGLLVAIGSWYLLGYLNIIPGGMWPVIVMAVGVFMIFSASSRHRKRDEDGERVPDTRDQTSPWISVMAVLGAAQRGCNAKEFQGGELTAVMGGAEIDLRHASIGAEPAVIDGFAFWGGIEIKVPRDWTVENRGVALLGYFGDKTNQTGDADKRLIIKGHAIMGGIEIKN